MNTGLKEQNSKIGKRLNLNEYQEKALRTAVFAEEYKIMYPALKLNGEAGEVAEKVGKVLRDEGGIFSDEKRREIALEVSDVLWYCAALADSLGYTLDEIGEMNIAKLADRYERGKISGSGDNR